MSLIPDNQVTKAKIATITDPNLLRQIEFTKAGLLSELEHRAEVRRQRFFKLKLIYWCFFDRPSYSRYKS